MRFSMTEIEQLHKSGFVSDRFISEMATINDSLQDEKMYSDIDTGSMFLDEPEQTYKTSEGYLFIQNKDNGEYDYTRYDNDYQEIDGGVIESYNLTEQDIRDIYQNDGVDILSKLNQKDVQDFRDKLDELDGVLVPFAEIER